MRVRNVCDFTLDIDPEIDFEYSLSLREKPKVFRQRKASNLPLKRGAERSRALEKKERRGF